MHQFYFDLHECDTITIDEEGREVEDMAAARLLALDSARDIMVAAVRNGRLCLRSAIVIRNAEGIALLNIPFGDAVAVTHALSSPNVRPEGFSRSTVELV